MTPFSRTFISMLLATVLAAGLAGWLGARYGIRQAEPRDLDSLIHAELGLTAQQQTKLRVLEAGFASERATYEVDMRAANRDLAAAIARDHRYSPTVEQAIQHCHRAMMGLQEATVRHVLAMRAVLSGQQARTFDRIVTKNLTTDRGQ